MSFSTKTAVLATVIFASGISLSQAQSAASHGNDPLWNCYASPPPPACCAYEGPWKAQCGGGAGGANGAGSIRKAGPTFSPSGVANGGSSDFIAQSGVSSLSTNSLHGNRANNNASNSDSRNSYNYSDDYSMTNSDQSAANKTGSASDRENSMSASETGSASGIKNTSSSSNSSSDGAHSSVFPSSTNGARIMTSAGFQIRTAVSLATGGLLFCSTVYFTLMAAA